MATASKARVIDFHAHINVGSARDRMNAGRTAPAKPPKPGSSGLSDTSKAPILSQIDARLASMDAMGIDLALLTPSPPRGFYKADEENGVAVARITNDEVARIARDHGGRILATGNVALQHVAASVAELERAMALGLKGMRIGTNIAGTELGDRRFDPFWARAEDLGALIFLHPQGFTEPKRLDNYYLGNAVGNPLETTLALAQMIFGGVFERYPRLKLIAAHGGGYFPFYVGRFEQAWRTRPECRVNLSRAPGEVLKQIWFDTVLFRSDQVAFLVNLVGQERVVMGTDSPYDMGENDPVALIRGTAGLDDAAQAAILGGNAASLLGLSA
jgi:aminocarboxymuconate-semialdehyde decarboxylase